MNKDNHHTAMVIRIPANPIIVDGWPPIEATTEDAQACGPAGHAGQLSRRRAPNHETDHLPESHLRCDLSPRLLDGRYRWRLLASVSRHFLSKVRVTSAWPSTSKEMTSPASLSTSGANNRRLAGSSLALLLLGACTTERSLMPTPRLYQDETLSIFSREIPAERKRPDLDLLYITDRAPEKDPSVGLPYGEERSRSLAFGSTVVRLGEDMDWGELEEQSHLSRRTEEITLELGETTELGRFPTEPYEIVVDGPRIRRSPRATQQDRTTRDRLHQELAERLAQTPNGEVLLYVHGFNETFATAAYTTAELCHFLGRENVCAFFTWPASVSGNLLTSYTRTTESATFAVNHLAKTLRSLSLMPEVKGVHLLAHSRGAALTMDALSRLGIEFHASGGNFFSAVPLRNLVLLSPDLDTDVAAQRIGGAISDPDLAPNWSVCRDGEGEDCDFRFTVYTSPEDRALKVSRLLFRSYRRVGRVRPEDLPEQMQNFLVKWRRFDLIVYDGERTDAFGHSFYTSSPVVSSDLVQLIRFRKKPGDPGRPLKQVGPVTWVFED